MDTRPATVGLRKKKGHVLGDGRKSRRNHEFAITLLSDSSHPFYAQLRETITQKRCAGDFVDHKKGAQRTGQSNVSERLGDRALESTTIRRYPDDVPTPRPRQTRVPATSQTQEASVPTGGRKIVLLPWRGPHGRDACTMNTHFIICVAGRMEAAVCITSHRHQGKATVAGWESYVDESVRHVAPGGFGGSFELPQPCFSV